MNLKTKPKFELSRKKSIAGFLFSLPFIFGFILFFMFPFIRSIYYSFCQITSSTDGMVLNFVGLAQFNKAFREDPDFLRNVVSSITSLCISLPSIILFSLFIAIILNQEFRGRTLARVVLFLPVVLYSGVVLLNFNGGLYSDGAIISGAQGLESNGLKTIDLTGAILSNLPFQNQMFEDIINSLVNQVNTVITMSGIQMLIFLSGLQTISPSIYEAADIEGTNAWEKFWKITFPMISPMIVVNAVFTIIDQMNGPTNTVMMKINAQISTYGNYGFAAAMNAFYMIVVIFILALITFAINKLAFYEDR